jgi:hypothetical protein
VLRFSRVFRHLIVAIVLGLALQQSGLAAMLGEAGCAADCPDDRSGGECPPNCHSCDCCSMPRTVPTERRAAVPLTTVRAVRWFPAAQTPPSVDPSEILHVPKRLA